jgi:hypothetical protein
MREFTGVGERRMTFSATSESFSRDDTGGAWRSRSVSVTHACASNASVACRFAGPESGHPM